MYALGWRTLPLSKKELFSDLLNRFLERFPEVEALIISDQEGLVIAGEKRKDVQSDLEIVSVLTTLINPVLERLRNEFAFQKFGTGSFDTDENRLLFVTIDEERILSFIFNSMASVEKISPYSYYLAEKVAQIIGAQDDDLIQLTIPDFEEELMRHKRLKESIRKSDLDAAGSYSFKFVVVGDHEVGKTSLIRRFVERRFTVDYRATIGLNILAHDFDFQGNKISLSLWDIGAQQYFKRFRKIYYTGAEAAFIVYDLANKESFQNIKTWYHELIEFIEDKEIPIVVVANKLDLASDRKISREEGIELANTLSPEGLSYVETSALNGENVEDAFKLIAYHYMLRAKQKEQDHVKSGMGEAISDTLKKLIILELSFINDNLSWSPGFQAIMDLDNLGEYSKIKDLPDEKLFAYKNGLIVNNFQYNNYNLANTDGAFIIFDAREKEHIDPSWKETLLTIAQKIRKKRVIIVGVRVSDDSSWSQLIGELAIEEELGDKLVMVLFLKIGPDFRTKIYDNIKVMLDAIVNTRNLK